MKILMRAACILMVALLLCTSAFAVDLYVDSAKLETDTEPTIMNGRTLVPVRAIFEALGATVEWDANTYTVTATKDATTIVLQIDSTTAYVNGEAKELDVPAQLINNRTMVPARFVSEALDCEVTWDASSETAAVAYQYAGHTIYVTATGKKFHFDDSCNGGTYYESTLAEALGRGLTPCNKCIG